MVVYTEDSRLSDVIFADSSLIAVLGRLGINLGVGDDTIGEMCRKKDISPDFLVAIINTFLNPGYFPVLPSGAGNFRLVGGYLHATCQSYLQTTLPNIERHLAMLRKHSGDNNNLADLNRYFLLVKEEIIKCATLEEERENNPHTDIDADRILSSWSIAEDQVSDLASFFVIHLRGAYDTNLCVAVVNAIFMLLKDLRQNNRLRRRLLAPMSRSI